MNQASDNKIQDLRHNRRCLSHRKLPQLSMPKSFLPRSISPTKEADALQLAWDILNDKVPLASLKQSETLLIPENENDNDGNNDKHGNSSDDATDTTDHSSSSFV